MVLAVRATGWTPEFLFYTKHVPENILQVRSVLSNSCCKLHTRVIEGSGVLGVLGMPREAGVGITCVHTLTIRVSTGSPHQCFRPYKDKQADKHTGAQAPNHPNGQVQHASRDTDTRAQHAHTRARTRAHSTHTHERVTRKHPTHTTPHITPTPRHSVPRTTPTHTTRHNTAYYTTPTPHHTTLHATPQTPHTHTTPTQTTLHTHHTVDTPHHALHTTPRHNTTRQ